ncbi:MAG: class I SAM-dependent methyltransferase [Deltaproteobacteria bacterium]|jgi:SAM-dependent methyltransferase|nr:class I SAM-dependent methyltransferase [Deltaproteobacteria bacterium]
MNDGYRFHARIYKILADRALGPFRRELAAHIKKITGKNRGAAAGRVLDLGCGTGALLRDLKAAGADAVGLDNSSHMLRHISGEFKVAAGSAGAAPFANGSFAVVVMSMLLHESDTAPTGILAEAARLLEPGSGRLLILEWKLPERNLDYLFHPLMHGLELCMGRRHYRNFRAFVRRGGPEGAIQRYNIKAAAGGAPELLITKRTFLGLGALILLEARLN